MSQAFLNKLKKLEGCLSSRNDFFRTRKILDKIEKCFLALQKNINLADVLNDPVNVGSLEKIFGKNEGYNFGVQLILSLVLETYSKRCFSTDQNIEERKQFDFLCRSIGAWKQFDCLISILAPAQSHPIRLVNTSNFTHWKNLSKIPADSLMSVFIRSKSKERSFSQEEIALDKIATVFQVIQKTKNLPSVPEQNQKTKNPRKVVEPPTYKPSFRPMPSLKSKPEGLSYSLEVLVHKMDTFVHAGNAHLIISHLGSYSGSVEMSVMRGEKKKVRLDADSIWSAEIRNGETVVFDFYGPVPESDFLKNLSIKTNKYTQMDKVANGY